MTKEQAINVLIQAVGIAQQKGAYTLQDAKSIIMAVDILSKKEDESEDNNGNS